MSVLTERFLQKGPQTALPSVGVVGGPIGLHAVVSSVFRRTKIEESFPLIFHVPGPCEPKCKAAVRDLD